MSYIATTHFTLITSAAMHAITDHSAGKWEGGKEDENENIGRREAAYKGQ